MKVGLSWKRRICRGHGKARVYIGSSSFDCEFQLPKNVKRPTDVTAIEVFTYVKIGLGYITKLTHDHRVEQRVGIGDIKRMEAIDGGEPLIWEQRANKNA